MPSSPTFLDIPRARRTHSYVPPPKRPAMTEDEASETAKGLTAVPLFQDALSTLYVRVFESLNESGFTVVSSQGNFCSPFGDGFLSAWSACVEDKSTGAVLEVRASLFLSAGLDHFGHSCLWLEVSTGAPVNALPEVVIQKLASHTVLEVDGLDFPAGAAESRQTVLQRYGTALTRLPTPLFLEAADCFTMQLVDALSP
jgi:hypothetical protein